MVLTNEKNTATFIHLSTLSQYIIPFGNYIFPIIIWSSKKNESEFIDMNGKNAINFQLSMFLYTMVAAVIAIPVFIYSIFNNTTITNIHDGRDFIIDHFHAGNVSGIVILAIITVLLFCFLKVIEFILIIYASAKASNGEAYKYPLTVNFIK
ncbi:DUF4870 domain-containing protein [Flavobacterium capsici]|uniref:DUF4870 domain-containing protein n=1 Tax=Flavobacterium capsici TaxID=3075618 RepID=A0AA96F125_9FLAO|nr:MULTISPECIES: DUF4870 domain-containing protein [unclassified Flavobacterium]WNM17791.1 DUF4870 domain-containing protein [Flavobacterium sp. PMR2A8]WNM21844.1 DUF4870 domain-containing protein [Flavobacterium sp. PMTSA4]